jgi:putative sigma-54 modulation protein
VLHRRLTDQAAEPQKAEVNMDVAMTARKGQITRALRTQAEEGMERIGRVLGRTARASITFSAQRHIHIVELTVQARTQKIAATGKAPTPVAALREAMAHAEHQAHRYRDRRLGNKRLPKEEKILTAPPVARPKSRVDPSAEPEEKRPRASAGLARASIAVHSFPSRATVVEPHVIKNGDAVCLKPMTIEEAVKDAEFRDRDLLIFRTAAGDMFVLHRRRDGEMELVEIS